jgi:hypothetical protein
MDYQSINYDAINRLFCRNQGKNRKAIEGQFNLEQISYKKRVDLICNTILSLNDKFKICRILFWEKDENIKTFLQRSFPEEKFIIYKSYENKKTPGICFIHTQKESNTLFRILLTNHFNYELAKEPALNIRVQIYIETIYTSFFLDIYDDRGFYMHIGDGHLPSAE